MPPRVPRKRNHSDTKTEPPAKRQTRADRSLQTAPSSAAEVKKYISSLNDSDESSANDESDDSDGSEEFEDVVVPSVATEIDDNDNNENEEIEEWEDVNHDKHSSKVLPEPEINDLKLTFNEDELSTPAVYLKNGKKGPTKKERFMRTNIHCTHVLSLMAHNTIRNSWLCDKKVHDILYNSLSAGTKKEIKRWKIASGLESSDDKNSNEMAKRKRKGGKGKGKGKGKEEPKGKEKTGADGKRKDWSSDAIRQETGVPDMSSGDPILRLLRVLVSYWKQRFRVVNPSLKKQGYRSVKETDILIKAYRKDPFNVAIFGERIESIDQFRMMAKKCSGSSDVGSQLFTALLRSIGLETRMVASLQPAGFGWSQAEQASKLDLSAFKGKVPTGDSKKDAIVIDDDSDEMSKPVKSLRKAEPFTNASNESSGLSDAMSIDLESDMDLPEIPTTPNSKSQSFPVYWTEVMSPITNKCIPVCVYTTPCIASKPEFLSVFEPRGATAEKLKQVICYVIAHSQDGSAKDVTVRYLKQHQLPGKTKGMRLPAEKIPIYDKRGKISKYVEVDWFESVMKYYTRPKGKRTVADDIEDQGDLVPFKAVQNKDENQRPNTLAGYKKSIEFVLEKHLRREEAIVPGAKAIDCFVTGKGDKTQKEAVYLRKDVVTCKTSESWHKEGREIRMGEQPLKMVTVRAGTWNRKKEVEEATRATGEKPTQGIYSREQTDWIIPAPIENGVIPKNAFGNIDVYVPSMVPKGAVHLEYKGLKSICRKLGIDFAEACTGFEFGHHMAVPIITGVVIAQENKQLVVDAYREDYARKKQKEAEKRKLEAMTLWRKFAHGVRIIEMIKQEYGGVSFGDHKNTSNGDVDGCEGLGNTKTSSSFADTQDLLDDEIDPDRASTRGRSTSTDGEIQAQIHLDEHTPPPRTTGRTSTYFQDQKP